MNTSKIYVLDIGTRKIAGLIMEQKQDNYNIIHTVIKEQLPNAMQDGQIHDIPKVAKIIRQVTDEISEYSDQPIKAAAVAAAGRSLLTQTGQATHKLAGNQEITPLKIKELELSAVEDALSKMNRNKSQTAIDTYLCVGYSNIQNYIDQQPIQNLIGHQGYSASVEIIATFLPKIVVDSLTSSLELANLGIASLTLEPIAAMHTVIPQSMRMLNIALVDIGAGTSDIAIAADGTIKAYGMISQAGDIFTRIIADHFLLDFMEAERIKRLLQTQQRLTCTDVLGNLREISTNSILELIEPAVIQLAERITDEVINLNDDKPKGIMLIGGGSLTPLITEQIAQKLGLSQNLVRIRDRASLKQITGANDYLGPQLITPISIGCSHYDGLAMQLQSTKVNDEIIQFLRLPGATVGDALLHSGCDIDELFGKCQRDLKISVNNEPYTLKGVRCEPATIYCNDQVATINTLLKGNDNIKISYPDNQLSYKPTLQDLAAELKIIKDITVNNESMTIIPQIEVNHEKQSLDYQLSMDDTISYHPIRTIGEALSYALSNSKHLVADKSIAVTVNDKQLKLHSSSQLLVNDIPASKEQILHDGDKIEYKQVDKSKFILADIFRIYQPPELDNCRQVVIKVNGEPAGYTQPLKDGDQIILDVNPVAKN